MDKIIIHNETGLDDITVMKMVQSVIDEGKVSETSQGKQYCFVTTFKNGYIVASTRKNDTYTFKVYRER